MDLRDLLRRPEGKTLEYKRDLSSATGAIRTMVAFANTSGGVLVVGVEDGSRHVRGVEAPLDAEERLCNVVSDAIVPTLIPDIEILSWRRTQVLAIEVFPSQNRPHHVGGEGPDRGVYVRVGSTNRHADRPMIEELRRAARGEAYDEQAMPDLDSEAIDFRAASESFSASRPLRKTDLESLRIITTHQRRKVPTVGGMLLFGKEREIRFPDAWIQAGRFRGKDRSVIADRVEMRGPMVDMAESALAFVGKHALHGADIGAGRRKERWNLPPVAVREAVINAVAHADYSQQGAPIRLSIFDDRLEIENPGLLPFGLTVDDLPHGISKLRNRVIGRVFHELGLMEQWGSGIQRMIAACREAGLDSPMFEEIGHRFRVTLHIARTAKSTVDDVDHAILEAVSGADGASTKIVATAIGLTTRATRTRLAGLVDRGLLYAIGTGPQDPRRRFYRTGARQPAK